MLEAGDSRLQVGGDAHLFCVFGNLNPALILCLFNQFLNLTNRVSVFIKSDGCVFSVGFDHPQSNIAI